MKIDRRAFLQGVGATSVVGTLSGLVPGVANASTAPRGGAPEKLLKREGEIKYHTCQRNCADRCLLKFTVQNGRMTYVEGASELKKMGTAPCVKGTAYVQYTYAADRILHPMERAGKKGEGKWRRITWDDAYKKISDKLKSIIKEHGADSILPYSYSGHEGVIGKYGGPSRFFNAIGSRKLDRKVCVFAAYEGLTATTGTYQGPDPYDNIHTNCYIAWGQNETATNVHGIKFINQARDKGAKLLVVNPMRTPIASQADIWLQPIPSTDTHLATGIMKYLVEKDLVDHEFIKKNTIGYDELLKRLDEMSYDEIEKVTGVPRQKMFEFAKVYGESELSVIRLGYGMQRNYNGARMSRAISMMHAIAGQFGKIGNGFIYDNTQADDSLNYSKGRADHIHPNPDTVGHVNMTEIAKALHPTNPTAYGKPIKPIKAVINYNGNFVAVAPDSNACRRGAMRDDLFLVVHDFLMTDTAELADIIVPSTTQFEMPDMGTDYNWYHMQTSEKVIEPLGESKDNWIFFKELGQHMGVGHHPEMQVDYEQILRDFLDTDMPAFKNAGITYDQIIKEKFVTVWEEKPYLASGKFKTPSGKIELWSQKMKDAGYHPVIDFGLPEDEMIPEEKSLPFRMISPAIPQRANSAFYNVKYIRNFPAYMVKLNTDDAKRLGIKNNDRIKLKNQRGEAVFTAQVSGQVPVGTVMTPKNNWRRMNPNDPDGSTNVLTTDKLTDMGGCSAYHSTRVDITKV
ncbi:molybdopterin-dependent oxidoreductase [Shewanella intestini]|uniref:Molybdopterin-dependent oxidoreductase n=1 Tax=Shewanella intestini TaxID=2017544 RepID=A0ABS5I2B9_9GAMM|nr:MULTISPECIES: molybdopterin-dependent oxidoreductase [Shewanella]MBR9728162.1 molybdopterin-dependent oxidoreductase [Shewanella intestini]MRG36633.1 molybdopterin-dependent oxidoreductase [Shewanella sp. XMDDZSB0408]